MLLRRCFISKVNLFIFDVHGYPTTEIVETLAPLEVTLNVARFMQFTLTEFSVALYRLLLTMKRKRAVSSCVLPRRDRLGKLS